MASDPTRRGFVPGPLLQAEHPLRGSRRSDIERTFQASIRIPRDLADRLLVRAWGVACRGFITADRSPYHLLLSASWQCVFSEDTYVVVPGSNVQV